MGGGTTIESNPAPQPSTADAVNAWVASLPTVYQTQLQYAPQEAAQQVALAQQYAGQLGQAYKQAQEAMYPQETAFTEQALADAQAKSNATALPTSMAEAYRDEIRANLGTNAGSPIGAEYQARQMTNALEDYRRYYQNIGLSISGKQPIYNAQQPQTSNYMQGFTPNASMNYMAQNYGTYVGGQQTAYQPSIFGQIGGGLAQGLGSGFGMGMGYKMMRG